jgi:predicted Fe-S protein YdhL (DUF1289 family)
MNAAPRPIATPCVQVCVVDAQSGLCLGCYRTLPEIGGWSRYTDHERAAIMTGLASRRSRIAPEKLGMVPGRETSGSSAPGGASSDRTRAAGSA